MSTPYRAISTYIYIYPSVLFDKANITAWANASKKAQKNDPCVYCKCPLQRMPNTTNNRSRVLPDFQGLPCFLSDLFGPTCIRGDWGYLEFCLFSNTPGVDLSFPRSARGTFLETGIRKFSCSVIWFCFLDPRDYETYSILRIGCCVSASKSTRTTALCLFWERLLSK